VSSWRRNLSMRVCDTCGGQLGDDQPFAVCSKCLFAEAWVPKSTTIHLLPLKRARLSIRPVSLAFRPPGLFPKIRSAGARRQGGQGDIWKAWDFELRRCVAMKRLSQRSLASETGCRYRFLADSAKVTSQLEHRESCRLFDAGLDPDGRHSTRLNLCRADLGEVWRQITKWSRSSDSAAPRTVDSCLRGSWLHAHSRGVIHRI